MDNLANQKAWGQLLSVSNLKEVFPIFHSKFVIGRNSDCDLPHVGNKLISGKHCYIEKANDGTVWLYDTSTNGTLLNLSIKLTKGDCRQLRHGDEFHIVHKKTDSKDDIGYQFEELDAFKNESSSEDTQDYTFNNDETLLDDSVNEGSLSYTTKRQHSQELPSSACKKSKIEEDLDLTSQPVKNLNGRNEGENSTPFQSIIVATTTTSEPTKKLAGVKEEQAAFSSKNEEDTIAETLVCSICQELLHDCISLQPCMHSFCAGCYSDWMDRSDECPSCRLKVERINKNHIVNNLVEAYLKVKPDKRRPEDELNLLDMKNKITRDMLYPKRNAVESVANLSDGDSYDSEDDNHNDDNVVAAGLGGVWNNNPVYPHGMLFGAGTPFFGVATVRAAEPVCRQCPNYVDNLTLQTAGSSSTADPDAKTFPTPPGYICPPGGNHVLCLCCMLPMPERRNNTQIPPQSCGICYRAFCHAYWGCRKADCNGCLGRFKDMNFGKKCLTSLILDNPYESQIFADYMLKNGLSVKDVLATCLAKMVVGDYVCTNQALFVSKDGINTPVCYPCGLRNFKDLAYCYRRDIPEEDLPAEVKSRPNCYWGKNCRTQRNKPDHSRRFNHICEQSRTML
ncbi:hypothetical protein Btru_064136 [Bulinus truncatus]|nr:hypothetical protein Btru_064136 [Bulinus truncatus]